MNLRDIYQNLLLCVTTFEQICRGSPIHLESIECKKKLEALEPIIIKIANEMTLEVMRIEINRKKTK